MNQLDNSQGLTFSDQELHQFWDRLADAWGMDTAEALALISAAANLTMTIERFLAIAEALYPLLARKARLDASQSGGTVGPTQTP